MLYTVGIEDSNESERIISGEPLQSKSMFLQPKVRITTDIRCRL